MLKQGRFLTAFQQDRNPLIQLNQDNIENTVIRRIMPLTLPTEKATIREDILNSSRRGIREKTSDLCNDPHVSHHTDRERVTYSISVM